MRPWVLLPLLFACSEPTVGRPPRDWSPPTLHVSSPARGTLHPGLAPVEVRGRVTDEGLGIAGVTVNGVAAEVGADGSFHATLTPVPGINLIQTRVTDGEGNPRSETRALLAGDLQPVEGMLPDALMLRLDREALRVIGELARRTVAETDFYALLAKENPLVNAAAPCFAARVELRRLSVGGVELALTPVGGGVELHATLSDIAVGFHVKYEAFCKNDEGEVSFTTERFRLDGKLALSLGDGGKITADASQTVAAFDRFVWGGDVLPARVRELLDQPLADALAVLIAGEVSKRVPALITRRVDGKPRTTEVRGEELVMALRPAALLADDRGLAFALDSSIYVSGAPGTVFPRTPAAPPALDAEATRGLRLAIADDALNQLLASLWGAGVFDQDLDIEQTDRLEQLGLVFDHLSFVPRLPPVAEAMPNGGGLRLTAGDVECQLVQRPEGLPPRVVARVVVSLRVTVVASVVDDRLMLRPMAPELFVDVPLEPGDPPSPLHEESLRALGDFVTDNLVTLLGEVVSGVPLPGLDELSIVDARAGSPPAGGYLELVGDVRLR